MLGLNINPCTCGHDITLHEDEGHSTGRSCTFLTCVCARFESWEALAEPTFAGIDSGIGVSLLDVVAKPITIEDVGRYLNLIYKNAYAPPPMEIHNPRCPKYLTQGKKACRCGAAPLDIRFDDELQRIKGGCTCAGKSECEWCKRMDRFAGLKEEEET